MEFAAPSLLALLLLPALVLALAFAPRRPVRATTGTLHLWRRAARDEAASGSRRQWRPPLWLLVAVLGLVSWAVALADPRGPAHDREEWLVLVDRRPRMLLPHPDGTTRLAVALRTARDRLRDERGNVRVRFSSPGLDDLVVRADDPLPIEYFESAPAAARPPAFEAHDDPGVLWLGCTAPTRAAGLVPDSRSTGSDAAASDAQADGTTVGAGFVASGGPAVPGFVARGATTWTHWEDGAFTEREPPPRAGVVLIAADAPDLIAEFARVFARTRGLEPIASDADLDPSVGSVRLVVERAPGGAPVTDGAVLVDPRGRAIGTLYAGRALGVAATDNALVALRAVEPAADGSGAVATVASIQVGHLRATAGNWREGEPETTALGLGELFDRALAPDPRLVPVAGRRDQGPTRASLGALPDPLPTRFELRAPLALLAAAAFGLAAILRRR